MPNPNGNWSYGDTASLGGALNPYGIPGMFDVAVANGWGIETSTLGKPKMPFMDVNWELDPAFLYLVGGETFSEPLVRTTPVVRWTVDTSGVHQINGVFKMLSFGRGESFMPDATVYVRANNTTLFTAPLTVYGQTANFNLSPVLAAGDVIDFTFTFDNGAYVDNVVGLQGSVVDPVPEPATGLTVASCVLALVAARRLRRRLR